MAIRRVRSGSFTTINNNVFNDDRLSAEALGILVYLLTKPADWQTMPMQLANRFGCGRNRIYRILKDLIEVGYITRSQDRNSDTRSFEGTNYDVTDLLNVEPRTQNRDTGAPCDGNPHTENPHTQNGTLLNTESTKNGKKPRPAKQQDGAYPEEFEALWKLYPRTKNTSKKKAHDLWRVLSAENQERVRVAVPIFAAAMRAEGRPEDKIKHMQFWLSERVYETVAAPAGSPAAQAAVADRYKTATRAEWVKIAMFWRMNYNWKESWGPEPGSPGCMFPDDLLTDLEKHQISLRREPRNKAQAAE